MSTPWFCRVCGADAPDFIPARTAHNRKNTLGRSHNVIALPCEHEQPIEGWGLGGLGIRTEEEQRAHLIATSPSPTGTRAYLSKLAHRSAES